MRLALLLIALVLSHSALQDLLLTDTGPTLESQMFLAATHGYAVASNGTVTLEGILWRIVGDGRIVNCDGVYNPSAEGLEVMA